MIRQRTIRSAVTLEGRGLHTGAAVGVRLQGAPSGSGMVFRRLDVEDAPTVRAGLEHVSETLRGVTLALGGGSAVTTVEHLLSATVGLWIDNLQVDVDGPELPALDGSALEFVRALERAEIEEQEAPARVIELEEMTVALGAARATTGPGDGLTVLYEVVLPEPLGTQIVEFSRPESYVTEIAPARTWGFLTEAEALRAQGLARGATADNVLVIGAAGYLMPPRFPDEPARHKILDLMGDLALLGARLVGRISVSRGGHALHLALARAIVANGLPVASGTAPPAGRDAS